MTLDRLCHALFAALEPDIDAHASSFGRDPYIHVAEAIEAAGERLATERGTFRRPERALFHEIRWCFPLGRQRRVWRLIAAWVPKVDAAVQSLQRSGFDAAGNPLRCQVLTRRGTPCERAPLPHNGHCPSHQHLVTEDELQLA